MLFSVGGVRAPLRGPHPKRELPFMRPPPSTDRSWEARLLPRGEAFPSPTIRRGEKNKPRTKKTHEGQDQVLEHGRFVALGRSRGRRVRYLSRAVRRNVPELQVSGGRLSAAYDPSPVVLLLCASADWGGVFVVVGKCGHSFHMVSLSGMRSTGS